MIDFESRNHCGGSLLPKDEEKWRREKVLEDLAASKTNYFYLGVHLLDIWTVKSYGGHEFDVNNYSAANFFDYCNVNFKLDKSQVSRYMNIVSEFGDKFIGFKEEWKPFSYSQLSEMLSLTPEQRKEVKPDWTIKRIREYKKELAGESVATSQQKVKEVVHKIYGELKPSERSRDVLDSVFHDFKEIDDLNFREFFDVLCDRLFVGFNFDGYHFSFTDKIKILSGILCFAQDISSSLESKDFDRFVNIQETYVMLRKLGYISEK